MAVIAIVFLFVTISCETSNTQKMKVNINKNWKFKAVNDSLWLDAEVPGSVHVNLMKNGIIEDPFYGLNEHNQQWIDKKDWEFQTVFNLESEDLNHDKIFLNFNGLDTYADVFLNGKKILSADNMFMKWEVECTKQLHAGKNKLHIIFQSPINKGLDDRDNLGYLLPGAENDQSELGGLGDKKVCVFSRKAQYHFGWDWGPRLVSTGIWQDIELVKYDNLKFNDVFINQQSLTKKTALLNAEIELKSFTNETKKLAIKIDGNEAFSQEIKLKKGENNIEIPLRIENPELWWTNGLGKQKLYDFEIIIGEGKKAIRKNLKTGLRNIELVTNPDETGKSFYFTLNGRPVFMKGANYIPQDVFLERVKPENYEYLIKSAADANFNMLRVWGGGIYEKDIFYDLCDKYGILVWQDFMFACAMYPGNDAFLQNIEKEATQNIKRLRNHPSIAIWCGENEMLSAWNNWGWKDKVLEKQSEETASKIWNDYDTIFHNILPNLVNKYDNSRPYWSSSPSSGIGLLESDTAGDRHYWGVWWGKEPFENYKTTIPRFMSEYGFQSFPEIESIKNYATTTDWDINSEVMKSHQRSSIGNVTIKEYMDRDYRKPKDFPSFIYVNHVLQAEGIKMAMEAHRRNMPLCMGSLYWQLNDCWPVASWSGIDYYGKWKALHYFAKKAFNNILISADFDGEKIKVYVVSDLAEEIPVDMQMKLIDFDGKILWENNKSFFVNPNKSQIHFSEDAKEIIRQKHNTLLYCALHKKDSLISENILYFDKVKNLNLPQAKPNIDIENTVDGFRLTISSEKLIKNIYLQTKYKGRFSDNYFDIIPFKNYIIDFKSESEINQSDFMKSLNYTHIQNTY